MNARFACLTALAGVHLALVVCGAAGWAVPEDNAPGRALRAGRAMTGSDMSFGFFAPDVASELRARFILTDRAGRTWTDALDLGSNPEVRLRVGNVVALAYIPALRQAAAASLAAAMFGRHPEAVHVVVSIDIHEPPTMAEYRTGARPEWLPFYDAAFSRTPATLARTER